MPRFPRFSLLLLALVCLCAGAMAQSGPRPRATQVLHRLGLLNARASITRTSVGAPGAGPNFGSQARLSQGSARLTASDLQFTFQTSGPNAFTSAQRSKLQNYLNANYARMVAIYGQPAPEQRGKTVLVTNGPDSANYFPPALGGQSGGGAIEFVYDNRNLAGIDALNFYNFTRLALTAFQGQRVPAFNFNAGNYVEPWLFGASDAAALLVSYGAAGSPANFDPSLLDFYVLPVYDFLNSPDLGNAYIYPRNGANLVVSDFRRAMAGAAFLKIAIENPDFFAQFNAALYARGAAGDPISPAQLEAIAAGVVPFVEGQSFNTWVRNQYVLDTSVRVGQKLYLAINPVASGTATMGRAEFGGFAEAFVTNTDGSEAASTGYGSERAYDETGREISGFSPDLSARGGLLNFTDTTNPGQAFAGAGFNDFGAPGRALVTIRLRFGQAEAVGYFPFNVAGTQNSLSSYYGGTLGVQNGGLQLGGSADETVPLARGAWAASSAYPSGPRVRTQFALGGSVLARNTAWLVPSTAARSVGFLLRAPANLRTLTFSLPPGGSRLRMVSLPFEPLQGDEAAALGLSSASTAPDGTGAPLARFVPDLSEPSLQNGALVFGVGGDKYEIFPDFSMPARAGQGFWLNTDAFNGPVAVQGGDLSAPGQSVEVALAGGWNQIGVPLTRAYDVSAIRVRFGGFAPVSLAEARNRGWVAPGIWRWLPDGGYARVDVPGGQLQPFEGYFIFSGAERGMALVFDPDATSGAAALSAPGAASSSAASAASAGAADAGAASSGGVSLLKSGSLSLAAPGGWSLGLLATGATSSDTAARFGVSALPSVAGPPPAARVVTLRFAGVDANGAAATGSGLAEAYVPALGQGASWTASVDGTDAGEAVTLSWDVAAVPANVKLVLVDALTGAQVSMNQTSSYSFTAGEAPRGFTIEAWPVAPPVVVTPPPTPTPTSPPAPTSGAAPSPDAAAPAQPADTAGESSPAPVAAANGAPSLGDASLSVGMGTPGSLVLAGSDPDGDALSYAIVGAPVHGKAAIKWDAAGSVWHLFYVGNPGFTGKDKIRVVTSDPKGAQSPIAAVAVTVVPDYVWRRSPKAPGGSGGSS